MNSYESILERVSAIPRGVAGGIRDICWLTSARVVGVSRDPAGHLELFLAGSRLKARTAAVDEVLEFRLWHRSEASPLSANRLLLPALGHFDQVGAFLCTELLRNEADLDLDRAFQVTEPIVELAIKRLQMSEAAMLGLVGELLLLNALCYQAGDDETARVVDSWDGWRRSSRDFAWEGTGVEVKTTTLAHSSHLIQGIHQIQVSEAAEGEVSEDRLLLVSVGLQQASSPSGNSFTIPDLVQRIVNRLEKTGHAGRVRDFVSRVAMYGSESGFGYDHASMADEGSFATAFTAVFFRGYDMDDPAVEVIRREDVREHQYVDLESVRFRISLPAVIGVRNPVAGANQVARLILAR